MDLYLDFPRGAPVSLSGQGKDFVTLVEKHWDGIIAWHTSHLTNGLLEGINSHGVGEVRIAAVIVATCYGGC